VGDDLRLAWNYHISLAVKPSRWRSWS